MYYLIDGVIIDCEIWMDSNGGAISAQEIFGEAVKRNEEAMFVNELNVRLYILKEYPRATNAHKIFGKNRFH